MKQARLLTVEEVADRLRSRPSTIYAWVKAGRIPAYKVGGLVRFDAGEVEEWIRAHRLEPVRAGVERVAKTPRQVSMHEVEGFIKKAIESVKGPGYNTTAKRKPDQNARKGGAR